MLSAATKTREYARWMRRRIPDVSRVFQAARGAGVGVHVAVPRLLRLVLREEYSPTEILMLGLLGRTPLVREATFISKRQLLRSQRRLNPRACFGYTENKLVFSARCVANRLATPRVLATVCLDACDARGVPVARTPSELRAVLLPAAPCDFVFKPVAGVHGEGILALGFDGTSFTGSEGRVYSAEDLFAHASGSGYRQWIVQDRIYPHRDLVALAGSQYLQTARVISYVDRQGDAHIPIAWLRIIAGRSVVDNFNFGASGNLVATIDVTTGCLSHVLGPGIPGQGLAERTRHPMTGASFAEFRVPFIEDVRDLVTRAALAFTPLRTIGWDVAITDAGPSLIEGNVTWDPLPTRQDLRRIAESLQ